MSFLWLCSHACVERPLHSSQIALEKENWEFHKIAISAWNHLQLPLPSEGPEISLNWWCSLKIKTNFLLISSVDCTAQSVKSLLQKWFEGRGRRNYESAGYRWGEADVPKVGGLDVWTDRQAHRPTHIHTHCLSPLLFLQQFCRLSMI